MRLWRKSPEVSGSYSMFCTCSRICSISTLTSTAARVVSTSCDFDDERVRFAIQLLHQEIEPPSRGLLRIEDLQDLGDVTSQAIELLLDVHLAGEKRDLLLEPVGVDVDSELRRTLCSARLYASAHLGQPRAHGRDPLAQACRSAAAGYRATARPHGRAIR